MVEMDWKTVLSFNYEDITDEDKDKVCESVTWMDPGDIEISFSEMKALFIVSQEMLRYKADQIQSLTSELDEMAKKQGEIEARLQAKSSSRRGSLHSKDLAELIMQQENEIDENKNILEKLLLDISSFEEQRLAAMKERNEDSSSSPDPISEMDKIKELGDSLKKKNQHLKDLLFDIQTVNEENKILQGKLTHSKEKLSEATFHIQDLTLLITNTRGENKQYSDKIRELQNMNLVFQKQTEELAQINKQQDAQMDDFAVQMDSRINDWKDILNAKQSEIKALKKHASQVKEKTPIASPTEPDFFSQMIKHRDDQIETLKTKLQEATDDMLFSAETIENLKMEKMEMETVIGRLRMGISQDSMEGTNTIEKLNQELQRYKVDKDDLEECLKIKEMELAETLKRINLFEKGELGLKEALNSNKKTKQQLKIRDEHINQLVAENNMHVHVLDQLQLENSIMRKKLNLPPEQPISAEDVLAKHAKRKKELNVALKNVASLEEEKISLQIQLRQKVKCIKKLCSYAKNMGVRIPEHFLAAILAEEKSSQAFESEVSHILNGSGDNIEDSKHDEDPKNKSPKHKLLATNEEFTLMKENYQHIVDENEGLRKGLHEIFDAIKERASDTSCDITSTCLEKLLQVLDARHVAGWYHPAMRMLLELQAQRGSQDGLRAMLKEARKEILSTLDLLAKESQKSSQLEQKLNTIVNNKEPVIEFKEPVKEFKEPVKEFNEPSNIDNTKCFGLWMLEQTENTADFTNEETVNETLVKPADNTYNKILQENLKNFHKQFEILYSSMMEIFTQSTTEKNKWMAMEIQYKNEIENLIAALDSVNARIDEIEKSKIVHGSMDSTTAEYQNMLGEVASLKRKNQFLDETLKYVRCTNDALKLEQYNYRMETFEKLKDYEIERQKSIFHIADLRNSMRKSVPLDIFFKQNHKMNDFEMKYRKLLNSHQQELGVEINSREEELALITENLSIAMKEKEELNKLLKQALESANTIHMASGESVDENIKLIASRLAECQTDVVSKNQRVAYVEKANKILTDQLATAHTKLENLKQLLISAESRIASLENENTNLQETEMTFINKIQSSSVFNEVSKETKDDENILKEFKYMKINNLELLNKLEALEEQINENQHDRLIHDLELNILRHQVLDLQSVNDNKAIVARLSGEILVSHLHTAEMHKKRDKLTKSLVIERDKKKLLKTLVNEKEIQFDNYVSRTNFKINFLSSALQAMREQYQGSIPLAILETIHNSKQEISMRLEDIENRELELLKKEKQLEDKVESESIQLSKTEFNEECSDIAPLRCPHFVQLKLKESKWSRDSHTLITRAQNLEDVRTKLESKIYSLEENLLLLTFSFGKNSDDQCNILFQDKNGSTFNMHRSTSIVELTDMESDDLSQIDAQQAQKPIPKPRTIIKRVPTQNNNQKLNTNNVDVNLPGSPIKTSERKKSASPTKITVVIQTDPEEMPTFESVLCQTDVEKNVLEEKNVNIDVSDWNEKLATLEMKMYEALNIASERSEIILNLESEKSLLESKIEAASHLITEKENFIKNLKIKIDGANKIEDELGNENKNCHEADKLKRLLEDFKDMEKDKEAILDKYKDLLKNEKLEHSKTNVLAQKQIVDMKMKIETLEAEHNNLKALLTAPSHIETYNSSMESYRGRILELEDRCFQLKRDMDNGHASLLSSKSECDRWKTLAAERFSNMEMLSRRLEEKHNDEVVSYKTETSHWLAELTNSKRELGDLKMEMNEQKANLLHQIAEKDLTIQRLHSANWNLKHQILNMQTLVSASDPTFDLAAIVEQEEENTHIENALIQSDRQVTSSKGDTSSDLDNHYEETGQHHISLRMNQNWSELVIDRVRGEKRLLGKQNAILRKQIRVLGARERRVRLELQNLRAQTFRTPNTVHKSQHLEDPVNLHRKIQALELQLSERNALASVNNNSRAKQMALWDKQKRWQETSERWKQRFEEKCEQLERLEKNLEAARVTVQRLERDKRTLDSRLSKHSRDGQTPSTVVSEYDNHLEMLLRDKERLEEEVRFLKSHLDGPVKHSSLVEKLESQQRRIIALELADNGKDVLVVEYERLLSQNSSLAKRNLRLESEVLDSQLRLGQDALASEEEACCRRLRQQNEHLENYIQLLKEENSQLIAKNVEYTALEPPPTTTGTITHVKRISDLERTVLTLRGLVSNLQAENKRLTNATKHKHKHTSKHFGNEECDQIKLETVRLTKVIREKDDLLEKAKHLLRKAAEKEKNLIDEISGLKEKLQRLEA